MAAVRPPGKRGCAPGVEGDAIRCARAGRDPRRLRARTNAAFLGVAAVCDRPRQLHRRRYCRARHRRAPATVSTRPPALGSAPNLLDVVPAKLAVSSTVANPRDFPEHLVDGRADTAWLRAVGTPGKERREPDDPLRVAVGSLDQDSTATMPDATEDIPHAFPTVEALCAYYVESVDARHHELEETAKFATLGTQLRLVT